MKPLTIPPNRGDPGDFVWIEWFKDLVKHINDNGLLTLARKATDPGAADITLDGFAIYKNTTTGIISLWVNDAGTVTRLYAFALAV